MCKIFESYVFGYISFALMSLTPLTFDQLTLALQALVKLNTKRNVSFVPLTFKLATFGQLTLADIISMVMPPYNCKCVSFFNHMSLVTSVLLLYHSCY
jgi:hypothetical protein